MEIDGGLDPRGKAPRRFAVEGHTQAEEDILQPHDPEAHRPPPHVGRARTTDGVVVQVDHPIELPHRKLDGVSQSLEVESIWPEMPRKIDGTEVADRRLAIVGDFQDLGAEV